MKIINVREIYLNNIRVKAFGKMGRFNILVTVRELTRLPVGWDVGVRIFDEIAGHYTLCHDLSSSQEKRLIKMALEN